MAMVEAVITEISPVHKPGIVLFFFADFLLAGFTSHIGHLTE